MASMAERNESEKDTNRETPAAKGTVAVDTDHGARLSRGQVHPIRPAAGSPPPRESERLTAPGLRKAGPAPTLVQRLLDYLRPRAKRSS
jgi:hypothetical protein